MSSYFNNISFDQSGFKNFNRVTVSPKKKKRKYSGGIHQHDSGSINIVDRVLDFSKYKPNTVLYVLCRDWMNATTSLNTNNYQRSNKQLKTELNENLDQTIKTSSASSSSYNKNSIKSLPAPIDIKNENIEIVKRQSFDFNLNDFKSNGDTKELLKMNIAKWKQVRKESIDNFNAENARYKESYDILKNIYESN
jgi:hypothetical protein